MTTGQRFSGYPARFGYATGQKLDLTQMQAFELDTNNTKTPVVPVGAVNPTAYITPRARPEFRIRTQDIKTMMDVVDVENGKCFDETSTFILQERADCGTFLTGDTHPARVTTNGFMYAESITAEQDSEDGAILSLRYVPLYDGSNSLVQRDTVDIAAYTTPALSPAYVGSYFLASAYENSVEISGIISVNLQFNLTFQAAPATPGAWDTIGSIVRRQPEFTYTCLKVDNVSADEVTGAAVDTSYAFYFQKADVTNAAGDGRVAKATAQHVKVSCTAGDVEVRNLSVDGTEDAAIEVSVKPTGTVAMSTASAIP
jgi:hypothetical protein